MGAGIFIWLAVAMSAEGRQAAGVRQAGMVQPSATWHAMERARENRGQGDMAGILIGESSFEVSEQSSSLVGILKGQYHRKKKINVWS